MKVARYRIPGSSRTRLGVLTGGTTLAAPADQGENPLHFLSFPEPTPVSASSAAHSDTGGNGSEDSGASWHLDSVELLAPLQPASFRDFYAFEAHVRNARRGRGLEMPAEWYAQPVFYFSNTACISGHGAAIRKPPDTQELDFELEIAAVIGVAGSDIPVGAADEYIAGFTILNDWSARDLQRQEMKVGLGPAKGKDFATSIGPFLVTPDELTQYLLPDRSRGNRYDLTMTATVNDRELSRGNARDMHWTFAQLIAVASRNTRLIPGDLIGSGTVGTGCIAEFAPGTHPWLQPGDVVRLEITGLGSLTNRITA